MQNITKLFCLVLFFCLLNGVKAFGQQTDSVSAHQADSVARYKADSITRAKGPKISGIVKDASTGKPVSGINISVSQYSAAITDEKGRFTISVPNLDGLLLIKGQSYQQKEIPIKGRTAIPEVLLFEENYASIYDPAKLPYGDVPVNQVASSVVSVNTLGAWEPVSTELPDTYLQGRIAGLNVVRRSGTPNAGANLFLRGINSLYATNSPLIVLDGMIYDNFSYGNSVISGHVNNPLSVLNLRDIANFTILKDAAAAAYGTKGANGVIIINTNSRPDLATRIDLGIYSSYNYINTGYLLPVMQAGDYRTYLADLLRTTGQNPDVVNAQPYFNDNISNPNYYVYHNNTDWQKEVFKNGYNQNYDLRVSGGDDIARYVLSVDYGNNKGITRATDVTRYGTRFNGNLNISKNLTVDANLSFFYNDQNLRDQGLSPKTNPIYLGLIKSPLVRVRQINAQGIESPNLSDTDIFGFSNPEAIIKNGQGSNRFYRFFGNINFKYQVSRYFSAQTLFGITNDSQRESSFIPRAGVANDTMATAVQDSRLGSSVQRLFNIYSDTRLNYTRSFNRIHSLNVNLGTRFAEYSTSYNFNMGYNSAIDELVTVGQGDPALRITGGDLGKYRWLNNYFNTEYQFYNKYLLSFNLAVDGSSRFGRNVPDALSLGGVKMAVLPAVSLGWIASSEKFMSDLNFIELLKLRASYGLTGNDDIGNYAARQYYVSQNLLGLQGLVRANFGNSKLQWEVNKKLNLGFDAALLQERLNISFDVYRSKTSNMIVQDPAASASGLLYVITNDGGMETKGFDLSVNSRIISSASVKWDLGFNISAYRNKITKLPNNIETRYAGATILTQVGMASNVFYGYKTTGVYTSSAEAAAAGISVRNANGLLVPQQGGDMRFTDVNGDKVIDAQDRQVIGNANPDFTGGITTGLTYKRFNINALLTFSKGNDLYNYTRRQVESASGFQNQSLAINNRWRFDGQITDIPRVSAGDPSGNSDFSDRWIEDGSYLRLRTLSVSYDIPFTYKFFKYFKVYATGNNLFTFTKYLGYDPEFAVNQSVFLQGIDTTLEPQFKTVQLGLRIGI